MKPKRYPSDLTQTQWDRLKRLLPPAKPGGRPREVNLREVLNGIFYIARGGGVANNLANSLLNLETTIPRARLRDRPGQGRQPG
jgi:transposase